MDLTFAIITYNNEKYILDHLNSIIYQIINFGNNYNINLIIGDDCSTDKTLIIIDKWLENNSHYFENIRILRRNKNYGIVSNYLEIIENIETKSFRLLAGDDLYYKENIFEIENFFKNYDIVFSNPIRFIDSEEIFDKHSEIDFLYAEKYINNINSANLSKNIFKHPGAFYKKELINKEIKEILSEYIMIEDLPLLYSLTEKSRGLKIIFLEKRYVLYRINDSSITYNKAHKSKNFIFTDALKFYKYVSSKEKNIFSKLICIEKINFYKNQLNNKKKCFGKFLKYINPYNYLIYIRRKIIKNSLKIKRDNNVSQFLEYIKKQK